MEKLNLKNLSIAEIVHALQEQNLQKYDFVIPSRFIEMVKGDLKVINKDDLDSLTQLLIDTGIAVDDSVYERANY